MDVPDILDLDVNTVFALLKGTSKPAATSFTIAEHVEPILKMVDIALGGDGNSGRFRQTPFLKAHISPVISPMRYGEDAVAVTLACMEHGLPISCITAAQSGVASSMTDAKAIDAQYGIEKGISSLAAGLAGGNLIYESSGMTASLLGVSFEAFILDDEMHSLIYRAIRGIEVKEDTLGFDAICEAVWGEGHFLGGAHTIAAMERDYFYPKLAD